VRRPKGDVHVESHHIDSVANRHPVLRKPFLRGMIVLGQSLAIGVRALMIAANQSVEDEEQLSSRQVGISLALAMIFFIGLFVLGPTTLFAWIQRKVQVNGVLVNVLEGVFRVVLFVAYLWAIGRTKEIHRVFEYHGAEHKTIAAYEHREELVPERIDRFPKEHVRCGTNFLIIVMIITIFVFTLFGTPGFLWRIGSRLIAIPIIAGLAYEALRLGARFPDSTAMRALMAPGIWLQKITTQEPHEDQIEVAVASFKEVLRRESEGAGAG
jgi:Predicted metal-dependent enzyme